MQYFILLYETIDNFVELRKPHRAIHLEHVKRSFDEGHLILGGAFADPPNEAAIIFRVVDRAIVSAFADNDVYVLNGLIQKWQIKKWNVVIGNN